MARHRVPTTTLAQDLILMTRVMLAGYAVLYLALAALTLFLS